MCRGVRAVKQSHISSIELIWLTLLFCALIALRAALHLVGPVRGQVENLCEYCKHVSLVEGLKEAQSPNLSCLFDTIVSYFSLTIITV